MTSTEWIVGPQNTKFFTKTWTPSVLITAKVLFVHGFIEHIERYDHVFPTFAENGILVFAFDQRGFGRTCAETSTHGKTSWPQALADISFFIKHLDSLAPAEAPNFLLGHSMGGALSLAFATSSPPLPGVSNLSGVLASSPLIRQAKGVKAPAVIVKLGSILGKISENMTLKAAVKSEDICRDPVIQKAYVQDPLCKPVGTFRGVADMLLGGETLIQTRYKNWPKSLPLLVVHGSGDKVTDYAASQLFVEKLQKADLGPAEFKGFEGFYHEMHNEPSPDKEEEIAYLSGWIKSKI